MSFGRVLKIFPGTFAIPRAGDGDGVGKATSNMGKNYVLAQNIKIEELSPLSGAIGGPVVPPLLRYHYVYCFQSSGVYCCSSDNEVHTMQHTYSPKATRLEVDRRLLTLQLEIPDPSLVKLGNVR